MASWRRRRSRGAEEQTYPTSLSSMVPGWKGGKELPLGGSLGEYSLNDLDEQPGGGREGWGERGERERGRNRGQQQQRPALARRQQ